jgi:hypothetical protein
MADDPTAPTGGGGSAEEFFALYHTTSIPDIIDKLIRLQDIVHRAGLRPVADGVGAILVGLIRDLTLIATEFAGRADVTIKNRIHATRWSRRPPRGQMETHVVSEPGPYGAVGVAKLSELDKIVNPNGGWGTYWRAQEYGTGGSSPVPSQVEGRKPLFGTFYESETPPEGAQAGRGVGADVAFIPFGSAPGFGRISVELPARHFLRDGSIEEGGRYVEAMKAVQQKWMTELDRLVATIEAQRGTANLTYTVEA